MYDIFMQLMEEKGVTAYRVAKDTGITQATLSRWKTGKVSPSIETLQVLAEYFGVTIDYLMGNAHIDEQTPPKTQKAPTLNKKDERDIARRLEETLNLLESSDALMFDGEPLDQESMDLLKTSLQNQYTLAKKIAKQKFTPKKYRNDNEK